MGLLTRERFLAIWIVLFAVAGLYLLGFLRLEGIKPDEHMGVGRLLAGMASWSFAISLVPGMFGRQVGRTGRLCSCYGRAGERARVDEEPISRGARSRARGKANWCWSISPATPAPTAIG